MRPHCFIIKFDRYIIFKSGDLVGYIRILLELEGLVKLKDEMTLNWILADDSDTIFPETSAINFSMRQHPKDFNAVNNGRGNLC